MIGVKNAFNSRNRSGQVPLPLCCREKVLFPPTHVEVETRLQFDALDHAVAQDLLSSFGNPISAPSANKSGYVSPTTAKHVADEFGDDVLILDGGSCVEGIESTVLSLISEP